MQTFLPYPDYESSARCLDRQRLGKQRIEVKQILLNITGRNAGWIHHPAVKMWVGHPVSLARYGLAVCAEWVRRNYRDNTAAFFSNELLVHQDLGDPRWLGSPEFHAAHRSKLLEKLPSWYGQYGWVESPGQPYVWPTRIE